MGKTKKPEKLPSAIRVGPHVLKHKRHGNNTSYYEVKLHTATFYLMQVRAVADSWAAGARCDCFWSQDYKSRALAVRGLNKFIRSLGTHYRLLGKLLTSGGRVKSQRLSYR
jgi:hypothetical protein